MVTSFVRTTVGRSENSLYLLAHEKSKNVAQTLGIHVMFTRAECRCYVPASIADVIPRRLSGLFLKPLGLGTIPTTCLLSPKDDACWYLEQRNCIAQLILDYSMTGGLLILRKGFRFLNQKSNHQNHHPSDGHCNESDRGSSKTILPKMHCHIN